MSQCVPSWDMEDNNPPPPPRVSLRSISISTAPGVPMSDYEVAELTWENGQLSMHGLGLPRVPSKSHAIAAAASPAATATTPSKYAWEKPRASGTLESIVNQATSLPHRNKSTFDVGVGADNGSGGDGGGGYGNVLAPWFDPQRTAAVASNTMTMDALVPCSNRTEDPSSQAMDSMPGGGGLGGCMVGCSTRVGSCNNGAATTTQKEEALLAAAVAKGARSAARVAVARELSSMDQSVSGSATLGRDSQQVTLDTFDTERGVGLASTSMGSPENTSSAKQCTKTTTADDHDSVCHSRPHEKETGDEDGTKKGTSISTKRSRAAAIHNQSERKRRDKINQRMKTLQKLVPNSSKTDKASMLDEVIEYLKQLQAQVQMMSRINMSSMMLPMAMQQQLQMSMMAPMGMGMGMSMGMGMGMGMGMDMSTMNRANIHGIPPVLHPSAFMPMAASWDAAASGDRLQGAPPTVVPDPLSTFFGCQSQPMTVDVYSRMAAMYQQLHQHQPPASGSKS